MNVRDPQTEKQLRQRAKFPAVQAFYQSVKSGILKEVYDLAAKEEGRRSGYHLFMHFNIAAFGENGFIDYSLLRLAHGIQQLPYSLEIKAVSEDHLYCFFGTGDRKRFSASKYFKINK